jgi:hypothetical protein
MLFEGMEAQLIILKRKEKKDNKQDPKIQKG